MLQWIMKLCKSVHLEWHGLNERKYEISNSLDAKIKMFNLLNPVHQPLAHHAQASAKFRQSAMMLLFYKFNINNYILSAIAIFRSARNSYSALAGAAGHPKRQHSNIDNRDILNLHLLSFRRAAPRYRKMSKNYYNSTKSLTFISLLAIHTPLSALSENNIQDCLYGTFLRGNDSNPVEPCGADFMHLEANSQIIEVMKIFNIPRNIVVFQSCPSDRFFVLEDQSDSTKFIIGYPKSPRENYLAPIVHELGHVVQIRDAGGIDRLRSSRSSHIIELGADFLAGLAFSVGLSHLGGGDFETNLSLMGSYVHENDDHGLPEHRTQAFRTGLTRAYPHPELTMEESLRFWEENQYARIKH